MPTDIYKTETSKPLPAFLADFEAAATRSGFLFLNREKMNMAENFLRHGMETDEAFDLHMVQICKPAKAAGSLQGNPERAALMPKFVMLFTQGGKTQVRFLRYGEDLVASLVDDAIFPAALTQSFSDITALIDEVA